MTTVGNYMRVNEHELAPLIENPDKINDFLYPENETIEYMLEEHRNFIKLGIGQTWHLIHFLLTGDAWGGDEALCNLTIGGKKLDEKNVDFTESVKYLLPDQVRATYEAVKNISSNELSSRFDADKVADAYIYPINFWSGSSKEFIEYYITEDFSSLKEFFKIAVEQKQAVLIWFN